MIVDSHCLYFWHHLGLSSQYSHASFELDELTWKLTDKLNPLNAHPTYVCVVSFEQVIPIKKQTSVLFFRLLNVDNDVFIMIWNFHISLLCMKVCNILIWWIPLKNSCNHLLQKVTNQIIIMEVACLGVLLTVFSNPWWKISFYMSIVIFLYLYGRCNFYYSIADFHFT